MRHQRVEAWAVALGLLLAGAEANAAWAAPGLPFADPEEVGMSATRLDQIHAVVDKGIGEHQMPGCVVAIGHQGRLVYLQAFGNRSLRPKPIKMTTDTVFDLASLTKPIATATSVMVLVEHGRIQLHDRVARYLPEFGNRGKEAITILQLLTHQGGLTPDNSLKDYQDGSENAWKRICELPLRAEPGIRFIYSDVGFIVLARLIEAVSGRDVHAFSQHYLFEPLQMKETGFLPSVELCRRAAPTEQRDEHWMQGEVHDPRAYRLGGIAGHAGLFSTATDLARIAQMFLDQGKYRDRRVLSAATVATMTADYRVSSGLRALGWDKRTGYSSNRGDLMSDRAFGHGGFTGTSLWMDPQLNLFVIFLSNRLHPDGRGSINRLAGRIGSIAVSAIQSDLPQEPTGRAILETAPVKTGIDVLQDEQFRRLAGRHIGLITNQTGINRTGRSTVELLDGAKNVDLIALFSPEHGLEGKLDIPRIKDSRDSKTGIKIYSLYGSTRRPTAEMFAGIDTLVFDIQDIGARFYTYISTMGYAMEAASQHNVRFVVLDRPNPINGSTVQGPVLDAGRESFVGYHTIAVRHGMTAGELALLFRAEKQLALELDVVRMEGWHRADFYDQTELLWVNPSPNMRSLNAAILYPGIGLLETTNLSVGRGTDRPFEWIGAPWMDARKLASELNRSGLPGIRFVPVQFTPSASKFTGERCQGVSLHIIARHAVQPIDVGLEIARQLRRLYPDHWEVDAFDRLLANRDCLNAVRKGQDLRLIRATYEEGLRQFTQRRAQWLLYPPGP